MLDWEQSESDLLVEARKLFEDTIDYWEPFVEEAWRAYDFVDGHQWDPEDVRVLEEEGRPALTFNLVASRLRHVMGAHEDNREIALVVPVDDGDQFAADVLNRVIERMRERGDADRRDFAVFRDGITCGKGDVHLDVYPDPKSPLWAKVDYHRIDPVEVRWDPASKLEDRSDARFLCWDKWLSKEEFKQEYPDHKDKIEEIMSEQDRTGNERRGMRYSASRFSRGISNDGYRPQRDVFYYDRARQMIRVIHMEYRVAVRRLFAVGASGNIPVDAEDAQAVRDVYGPEHVIEVWDEEMRWLEFVGDFVLYNDLSPMPYSGFSIVNYTTHIDYATGLPYGEVRNLVDPQKEVNKRHSQMLNLLASQTQPGVFAEVAAVPDKDEFELSLTEAGSTTWLNSGGLDRVRERTVPDFPEAPARLFDVGMKMVEVISGIFTDELTSPRGIPEAAATAQLKHRRSQLMQLPLHNGFNAYQKAVRRAEIEIVIRVMPDDQIAAMLGNDKKYSVREGVVSDNETGLTVDIRDLRKIRYDVTLEIGDRATSQRMLELQTLVELQKSGIPVDPEIIVGLTTLSADKKARLSAYSKSASERAVKAEESKAQTLVEQLERTHAVDVGRLQLEAGKLAETRRSNVAKEILGSIESVRSYDVDLLSIWEKADAAEKAVLQKLIDAVTQRQKVRAQAAKQKQGGSDGARR